MALESAERPARKSAAPIVSIDEDSDVSVDEQLKQQFAENKTKISGVMIDALGNEKFIVPADEKFTEAMDDFLPAPELEKLAQNLIDKYDKDFRHLYGKNLLYLWKQKGGASGGQDTFGKCVKPSGLTRHLGAKDRDGFKEKYAFIIWVAADHARNYQFTLRMMNALLFHELMHTDWDDGKFITVGHEFEGGAREIEEFGMWRQSIKNIAKACETLSGEQMGLFD